MPFNELPTALAREQITFAIMPPSQAPDPGPAADGRPASEPEVTPAGPSGPRIWPARLGFGLPFRIAYSPYFHINRREPLASTPIAL